MLTHEVAEQVKMTDRPAKKQKREKLLKELQKAASALHAEGGRAEILGNGTVVLLPDAPVEDGDEGSVGAGGTHDGETDVVLFLPRSRRSIRAHSGEWYEL